MPFSNPARDFFAADNETKQRNFYLWQDTNYAPDVN